MIAARDITVKIADKLLLDQVTLELRANEVLAILGANGAGKTTLRRVLSGDVSPTSGEVLMNNRRLHEISLLERARMRAVLPQESSLNFPFSVLEVVLMGRAPHVQGAETAADLQISRHALEAVEAAHLETRLYPTLSGGERQRVQLARVLAQVRHDSNQPKFLLLDEPTANLDLAHQHSTLRIARQLTAENIGTLIILHDLNLAAQYADRIALLQKGKIVGVGSPAEVLTEESIRATFSMPVHIIAHPHFPDRLLVLPD